MALFLFFSPLSFYFTSNLYSLSLHLGTPSAEERKEIRIGGAPVAER